MGIWKRQREPENITAAQAVTKKDYLSLAAVFAERELFQQIHKEHSLGCALRAAAVQYEQRDYVSAYELFKPVYNRVMADVQRTLARDPNLEAAKLAKQRRHTLAVSKEKVRRSRANAQQLKDRFERLFQDLLSKSPVQAHINKAECK